MKTGCRDQTWVTHTWNAILVLCKKMGYRHANLHFLNSYCRFWQFSAVPALPNYISALPNYVSSLENCRKLICYLFGFRIQLCTTTLGWMVLNTISLMQRKELDHILMLQWVFEIFIYKEIILSNHKIYPYITC